MNSSHEAKWRDAPEAIADWVATVGKLEPVLWAPGEREAYDDYLAEHRRFNRDAVRRQMETMTGGDPP